MRIGLNLLHALPEIGGGWNYIANLVGALGQCDETNSYIAFVTRESEYLVPAKPNFRSVLIGIRSVSRLQRILYENTFLQVMARNYNLDCMHWFANTQALINTVPGVVTIHDLGVFENAVAFPQIKRVYLHLMMMITAKRAKMLLPVSRSTANKLQKLLHIDPSRMVVIPVMLPPNFVRFPPDAVTKFKAKYGLPNEFWLYVAHFYPHKNHVRLIYAYHQLKLSGVNPWPLILRGDPQGAETQVSELITSLGLEDHVILLPRLDNREMPLLYSAATALIFPSLYEGGGIPVIEAMTCSCPVVASNIPAVQEFAGDAALYFDPTDVASICEAMRIFQNSPQKREACRRLGLVRAAEFRPERLVNRLLQAYTKASEK